MEKLTPKQALFVVEYLKDLNAEQADALRAVLTENVKRLPKEQQAKAMIQGWSKLKAHFKTDYRHIPASEFNEAVGIAARHVAQWIVVDKAPAPAPIDFAARSEAAQEVAQARRRARAWG